MKKSILFLTHHIRSINNPGGYRIQQYFPYFEKQGYEVIHLTSKTDTPGLLRALRRADVLYVQRLLPNLLKQQLLRLSGKSIVFDFDDAIMYGSTGESATRRKRFERMVRMSRAVFCGNQFLAAEARRYKTADVFCMPTVVNPLDYPVKEHTDGHPFVVGWMGSASTLRYLASLEPLFSSVPGASFKVVADKAPDGQEGNIAFEKWSGEREKEMLLGFDAGIMPVRDDIWSRGKCGLKLLQYGAAGLPSISHPFGVSTEIIEDGQNGFLRSDIEGWREAVERLGNDVALRQRMGKRAREMVEERYSLRVWGPRLVAIVEAL
jgi:glycosyltransferase involved in cell wall biosynthesis